MKPQLNSALRYNIDYINGQFNSTKQKLTSDFQAALPETIRSMADEIIAELCSEGMKFGDFNESVLAENMPEALAKKLEEVLNYIAQEKFMAKINEKTNPEWQFSKDQHAGLVAAIKQIMALKCELIANYASYHQVLAQLQRIEQLQAVEPNGSLEMIILKRHEASSNSTKGMGLVSDAGLDALTDRTTDLGMKYQTIEQLHAAQIMQETWAKLMKQAGVVSEIDLLISPVKRAQQTALHASFNPEQVRSVRIDNTFAETQFSPDTLGGSLAAVITSGRASKEGIDGAQAAFNAKNYRNVSMGVSTVIEGETKAQLATRASRATDILLEPSLMPQDQGLNIKMVVGHGGMNIELMKKLKERLGTAAASIPFELEHLKFGGQYILIAKRDANGQLTMLDFDGNYDHYGLRLSDEHMGITNAHKFLLNLASDGAKLSSDITTLYDEVKKRPDNRNNEEGFSYVSYGINFFSNMSSGKGPEAQEHCLKGLKGLIDAKEMDITKFYQLKAKYFGPNADAALKLASGKVSKLVDAWIQHMEICALYRKMPYAVPTAEAQQENQGAANTAVMRLPIR